MMMAAMAVLVMMPQAFCKTRYLYDRQLYRGT